MPSLRQRVGNASALAPLHLDRHVTSFWRKKVGPLHGLRATATAHNQHTMAAVYKTLSATNGAEKEPAERRNRQRVLILVRTPALRVRPRMLTPCRVPVA